MAQAIMLVTMGDANGLLIITEHVAVVLNSLALNTAEPTAVEIGWTLSDRDKGYVSYMDGWRAGTPQHIVSIEVDLPPYKVADLVFLATNAPELEAYPEAAKILAAVQATGYRGVEAGHFSLSVGDTVTVGSTRLACMGGRLVSMENRARIMLDASEHRLTRLGEKVQADPEDEYASVAVILERARNRVLRLLLEQADDSGSEESDG